MTFIRRIHTALLAYFVKWQRTRKILHAFSSAHNEELRHTPVERLPIVLARQNQEIKAVRAGKLDTIVDRKSWQWPYLPASVQRLSVPLLKPVPYNLRRMSRTPVPRRAINLIKGALIAQPWDIQPVPEVDPIDNEDAQQERMRIGRKVFSHPNNTDSFQTFVEQCTEDMCVVGAFVSELGVTIDPERPLKMWPVNAESIRLFPTWTESTPDMPRYAQMTGLKGERGAIVFYDDELMYIRDNPATDNPFGLGKMEVAFASVNAFLGVQDMAGRAGTDQVHKTFLWWEAPQSEAHVQIVRRYIQNDLEGQAKLSLIAGMKKPEAVEVTPVTEADLLLNWQELLIRMIANAFDMSAMALGVEHDVNRAVGEVLTDRDFRSAVVPMAKRVQEGITRKAIHGQLGWYDLQFVFLDLDDPDAQTKMDLYTRMYSTNSITPRQICKKMRMEEPDSPFADLTQFESQLILLQAQEHLKAKAAKEQAAMGGGMPPAGPGGAPGGAPSMPSLGLPKGPMTGSIHSARDVAQMDKKKVAETLKQSQQKPSQFLKSMDENEPGILQQLADDVKEYLKHEVEKEAKRSKISPALLKKWAKDLETTSRAHAKRESNMTEWLQEVNSKIAGRPGVGLPKAKGKLPRV